jgi:hypothetical protein
MTNVDDMFKSESAPFLKFSTPGTKYVGVIADIEKRQQRDFQTGEPLSWPDGEPRWELVVTLTTDERDPDEPKDDGKRRLAVKKGTQMWGALADALRQTSVPGPQVGAKLAIAYTGDGESKTRGFAPPKLYAFAYEKPTSKVDDMFTPAAAPASDAAALSKLLAPTPF